MECQGHTRIWGGGVSDKISTHISLPFPPPSTCCFHLFNPAFSYFYLLQAGSTTRALNHAVLICKKSYHDPSATKMKQTPCPDVSIYNKDWKVMFRRALGEFITERSSRPLPLKFLGVFDGKVFYTMPRILTQKYYCKRAAVQD